METKICFYLDEIDRIREGEEQYPICCEIDPSNLCQNRCSFCCYSEYLNEHKELLPFDLYLITLEEMKHCGVKSITFTGGGEPTLHPKFIEMAKKAYDLGFEIGLVTNGIRLNFIYEIASLFRFIRVSLDACCPETYKEIKKTDYFYTVVENMVDIRSECKTLGISFVVCEKNRKDLKGMAPILDRTCADYLQVKPMLTHSDIEYSNGLELDGDATALTKRYVGNQEERDLACEIAGLVGVIGANSKLYYCCITRGNEDFVVGDLKKARINELFKKRNIMKINNSKCLSCRYLNYVQDYKEFCKPKYSYFRHKSFL